MNKSYLALAILLTAAAVLYTAQPQSTQKTDSAQYLNFLQKYNKPLPKEDQLLYRSQLFAEYLIKMEKHNSNSLNTWKIGVNQFSDLTQEEFRSTYLGELQGGTVEHVEENVNAGFTETIDWRTKKIVTDVKNQGQCGSCWAFGATASHESYQIQENSQPITIDLSEQQLVDCATASPYSNHGCNGGLAFRALEYVKDHGQITEAEYPYKAINQACAKSTGDYHIKGVTQITGCSEIEEMLKRRPMAVRVDASNWHLYKSGIFNTCDKGINHAVFMVGTSDQAWTIKNSWGKTWGEDGYIRLAKGDTCAVCQGPSFAV